METLLEMPIAQLHEAMTTECLPASSWVRSTSTGSTQTTERVQS